MRNFTLGIVLIITTLFSAITFGQIDFPVNNSPDIPYGLQNKYGIADTPSADVSVLIISDEQVGSWVEDVEYQLESTGLVAADTYVFGDIPELELFLEYDAILFFVTKEAKRDDRLINHFIDYISAGGGVVDAPFLGRIQLSTYLNYRIMYRAKSGSATNLGLGTIYDTSHPILDNVQSINGGSKSYHHYNGSLNPSAIVIADYTNGEPLVIINEDVNFNNARRAFLNVFPPSGNAVEGLWDVDSDVALLMANALKWVSEGGILSEESLSKKQVSLFPNPVNNTLSISNPSGYLINQLQIIDITGRIITSLSPKSEVINNLDVSNLTAGTYLLRLQTNTSQEALRFVKQ